VLSYWGKEVAEAELMKLLGTSSDVGTFPERIVRGVRSLGLEAEAKQDLTLEEVRRFTADGKPMIALGQLWRSESQSPENPEEDWDCGHYIVVLGVDDESVYFQDPYLRMGKGFVPRRVFEQHWHQVMGGKQTGLPELNRLGIFIRGKVPAPKVRTGAGTRPALDLGKLGSLNLITSRFRGSLLPFDFMDRLRDIWGSGDVRPAAFVLIRKSAEGEVSAMTGGSLEEEEDAVEINAILSAMTSRAIGAPRTAGERAAAAARAAAVGDFGLSTAEIHALAAQVDPGTSAIIVLFENAWERRFRAVAREHGGEVVDQRAIPREVLTRLGEELERR
jgi:hypothetical protein